MHAYAARPLPHSYWVQPGQFLVGEHPGSTHVEYARRTMQRLLDAQVSVFVDLTEEGEWEPYIKLLQSEAITRQITVDYGRTAIPDCNIPSNEQMVRILDTIDTALAAGRKVYLHCLAGIGRTGTVVGCYLVRHGMEWTAALDEIAELRRGTPDADVPSPETEEQRQFILNWRVGS